MRPKYEFAYNFTHRGDGIPCKCKEIAVKYIQVFKSSTNENPKEPELEYIRNEYYIAKDQCTVCKPLQEARMEECYCGFIEDYLWAITSDDEIPYDQQTPELLLPLDLEWRYCLRHCLHCRLEHSHCIWCENLLLDTPRRYSTIFHLCLPFKSGLPDPDDVAQLHRCHELYIKCMLPSKQKQKTLPFFK